MENYTLLLVAALNCITAYLAWRTHQLTQKVELATNSMKDALVKSTGEEALARGTAEGLARGREENRGKN